MENLLTSVPFVIVFFLTFQVFLWESDQKSDF
jgi:hypothetical protein